MHPPPFFPYLLGIHSLESVRAGEGDDLSMVLLSGNFIWWGPLSFQSTDNLVVSSEIFTGYNGHMENPRVGTEHCPHEDKFGIRRGSEMGWRKQQVQNKGRQVHFPYLGNNNCLNVIGLLNE